MTNITDYILSKTKHAKAEPEVTASPVPYQMFNTGGVEVEVGELLYSLVRVWKPTCIVETGTHLGISALYMALACEKNGHGRVNTYEVIPSLQQRARALWADFDAEKRIDSRLIPSLKAEINGEIDLLFLDSEPQFRFDEFLRFWPQVKEGGIVAVHDLHPTLGKSGINQHGMKDWPYGEWEPKLGKFVKDFDVQILYVPNPRGTVLFQKTRKSDENIKLLRSSK